MVSCLPSSRLPGLPQVSRCFSENGHSVPNEIANIVGIFQGVDGAKGRGACFSTKESDQPFLNYSHVFDLEPSHEPNQRRVNIPRTADPISQCQNMPLGF